MMKTPEDIEIERKRILAKNRKRRQRSSALAKDFGGEERMQRLRETWLEGTADAKFGPGESDGNSQIGGRSRH